MFGFGKKKEPFTLDKLFSGYMLTKKDAQQKREDSGFKLTYGIVKGSWSDISNMQITDHENSNFMRVIGTTLILFSEKDTNHFVEKMRGLRLIDFKLNRNVPIGTELPTYKTSYKGWVLPNGNILSETIKKTDYYAFSILDSEQIITI